MRKIEPTFTREYHEDDTQRLLPSVKTGKVYNTVSDINLNDVAEGERVVTKDTLKSYTKIDGELKEV